MRSKHAKKQNINWTFIVIGLVLIANILFVVFQDEYAEGTVINRKDVGGLNTHDAVDHITYVEPDTFTVTINGNEEDLPKLPVDITEADIEDSRKDIILSHVPFLNMKYKKGVSRKITGLKGSDELDEILEKTLKSYKESLLMPFLILLL